MIDIKGIIIVIVHFHTYFIIIVFIDRLYVSSGKKKKNSHVTATKGQSQFTV